MYAWATLSVGPNLSDDDKAAILPFVDADSLENEDEATYSASVHTDRSVMPLLETLRGMGRRIRYSLRAQPPDLPFPIRWHTNLRCREIVTQQAKRLLSLNYPPSRTRSAGSV
jgi:hypothetical protein